MTGCGLSAMPSSCRSRLKGRADNTEDLRSWELSGREAGDSIGLIAGDWAAGDRIVIEWDDMSLPKLASSIISPSKHAVLSWKITRWTDPVSVLPTNGDHTGEACSTYGLSTSTSIDVPGCSWSSNIALGLSCILAMISSVVNRLSATAVNSNGSDSAMPIVGAGASPVSIAT